MSMGGPQRAEARAILAAEGPKPLKPWTILAYDTQRFPFAELLIRDVYKVRNLSALHEYLQAKRRSLGLSERLSANDNLTVRKMMQDQPDDSPFYKLYRHFMLKVLSPLVGRGLSYSSHPKMRVHFPGTESVSSFHHDIIVTKRIDQINFWMPFTDVDGTATLWLESDYGAGDYAPIPVRYGEVLIFDGGYIGHGSVPNESGVTRISLDMRFSYKGAATRAEGVDLMNRIIARIEDGKAP
ncbi:streptomycin biosynthesis enzyme StrG [Paenibacillus sp. PR3]|uniref:Streptomycin biosynthesis enzyme StrG n=1 Tax=Paenibacillus terricola TaxID=2763503 RepID=A0ABR8MZB3_9BACL|nr:streptomycin biosynthesis enzyme StrG [Paenibacillus terricola]MBD3921228.1 streptomycin biosynthesis enzyme StrG [Paenibacillus terricola]